MDGPDPRGFSGAEWRDKIRVLYDFQRLNLNFATIVFRWQENDMDEDMNLLEDDWNKPVRTMKIQPGHLTPAQMTRR